MKRGSPLGRSALWLSLSVASVLACSLLLDDPALVGVANDATVDALTDAPPLEISTDVSSVDDASDASLEASYEASVDASDAGAPTCDPLDPFTTIVEVPFATPPNGTYRDSPRLSEDELTIYFATCFFSCQINVASRSNRNLPFTGAQVVPAPINDGQTDRYPWLSSDGLSLFFSSNRQTDAGLDIARATRASAVENFGNVIVLGTPVSLSGGENFGSVDNAGTLYYSRGNAFAFYTLHTATFSPISGYSEGPTLSEIGPSFSNDLPLISRDGRVLYFISTRPLPDPTDAGVDAAAPKVSRPWRASRTDTAKPFDAPVLVLELKEGAAPSWLSPDGCRLYFSAGSGRLALDGGAAPYLWMAERAPR